ncbi:polyprenyl synthetase family protein [Psychrobacter sp. Sarcosine-3u-12]|uniref:polyprenyl synthetase family protein n=1 Tax=Psychrobacter sp. Sarcosine-3u-12 TaxID=2058325 RepID=UPI000C32FC24|nr:polyprenyl synthetase family protein [Psychrobacter sp. Sarcosine-3u-12]PKG36107.1 farnesyl-diphosphate synthase [Psychrobacter sp. Sarcosine-3u-12]
MTVSSMPSFMPSRLVSFASFDNNTEQFHSTVRAQLSQDIDVLFAYAELPSPLLDACRYVMTGQGKLVRPLLVASAFDSINRSNANDAFNNNDNVNGSANNNVSNDDESVDKSIDNKALQNSDLESLLENDSDYDMARRAALAVELLHTYSLVHDDLPCMDDDDLRRGQPTAHIVFAESTALLAGDVLQTLAFEVLTAELPTFAPFDSAIASQLIAIFAPRARRMVSGQMLDLNAEASIDITQSELEAIHRDKTGALIEAAMLMGGICAGATAPQRIALQDCAQHIGLAFQVQDDILDVTTSTDTLGKPAGSDEKLDKSTYVKLMGVEQATSYAQSLFNDGRAAIIRELGDNTDNDALLALIEWLWSRKK